MYWASEQEAILTEISFQQEYCLNGKVGRLILP